MSQAGVVRWANEHKTIRQTCVTPVGAVREWLRHTVLLWLGLARRAPESAFVRCLHFHYVYDDQVEAFRDRLTRLRRIGRFISTAELCEIIAGRRAVSEPCFHLSCDDGFDNIHRNACPVLRSLEIPAAIFVPTAFMGASDEEVVQRWWKPHEVSQPTRPMSWEQLRELAEAGFDVGSHTRHHARLSDVSGDAERLRDELTGSKEDIERHTGRPCRYISWPYGLRKDIDEASLAAIEQAGYEACFSTIRGAVTPGRTSRFEIPRHNFEPQSPWLHVRYFALGGMERGHA
ncbi:MAG TPA: polysaccharide deacetylase family protein [Phycisphaerae bacterium]|nr:polysaccharide deacetylase family protein [Phycisphaerae bacterium]